MIHLRAATVAQALEMQGLASDAAIAVDGTSLDERAAAIAALPAGRTIAWSMPVDPKRVLGWVVSRARRARPVALADACEVLRRAGVVDVRVIALDGALETVVVTGRTT